MSSTQIFEDKLNALFFLKKKYVLKDAFYKLLPFGCLNKKLRGLLLRNGCGKLNVKDQKFSAALVELSKTLDVLVTENNIPKISAVDNILCSLLMFYIRNQEKIVELQNFKPKPPPIPQNVVQLQGEIGKLSRQSLHFQSEREKLMAVNRALSIKHAQELQSQRHLITKLKEESAASESKFQDSEHRLQAALIKLDSVQADYKRCDHELKVLRNHHQQLQTNATNSSSNALNKRGDSEKRIQEILNLKSTVDFLRQELHHEKMLRAKENHEITKENTELRSQLRYLETSCQELQKLCDNASKSKEIMNETCASTFQDLRQSDQHLVESLSRVNEMTCDRNLLQLRLERAEKEVQDYQLKIRKTEAYYYRKSNLLVQQQHKICYELKNLRDKWSNQRLTSSALVDALNDLLENQEKLLKEENRVASLHTVRHESLLSGEVNPENWKGEPFTSTSLKNEGTELDRNRNQVMEDLSCRIEDFNDHSEEAESYWQEIEKEMDVMYRQKYVKEIEELNSRIKELEEDKLHAIHEKEKFHQDYLDEIQATSHQLSFMESRLKSLLEENKNLQRSQSQLHVQSGNEEEWSRQIHALEVQHEKEVSELTGKLQALEESSGYTFHVNKSHFSSSSPDSSSPSRPSRSSQRSSSTSPPKVRQLFQALEEHSPGRFSNGWNGGRKRQLSSLASSFSTFTDRLHAQPEKSAKESGKELIQVLDLDPLLQHYFIESENSDRDVGRTGPSSSYSVEEVNHDQLLRLFSIIDHLLIVRNVEATLAANMAPTTTSMLSKEPDYAAHVVYQFHISHDRYEVMKGVMQSFVQHLKQLEESLDLAHKELDESISKAVQDVTFEFDREKSEYFQQIHDIESRYENLRVENEKLAEKGSLHLEDLKVKEGEIVGMKNDMRRLHQQLDETKGKLKTSSAALDLVNEELARQLEINEELKSTNSSILSVNSSPSSSPPQTSAPTTTTGTVGHDTASPTSFSSPLASAGWGQVTSTSSSSSPGTSMLLGMSDPNHPANNNNNSRSNSNNNANLPNSETGTSKHPSIMASGPNRTHHHSSNHPMTTPVSHSQLQQSQGLSSLVEESSESLLRLQARNAALEKQIQSMPTSLVVAQAEKRVLEAKLEKSVEAAKVRETFLQNESQRKEQELIRMIDLLKRDKRNLEDDYQHLFRELQDVKHEKLVMESTLKEESALKVSNFKESMKSMNLHLPPWHEYSLPITSNGPSSASMASSGSMMMPTIAGGGGGGVGRERGVIGKTSSTLTFPAESMTWKNSLDQHGNSCRNPLSSSSSSSSSISPSTPEGLQHSYWNSLMDPSIMMRTQNNPSLNAPSNNSRSSTPHQFSGNPLPSTLPLPLPPPSSSSGEVKMGSTLRLWEGNPLNDSPTSMVTTSASASAGAASALVAALNAEVTNNYDAATMAGKKDKLKNWNFYPNYMDNTNNNGSNNNSKINDQYYAASQKDIKNRKSWEEGLFKLNLDQELKENEMMFERLQRIK